MRVAMQILSIVMALLLGILFGIDYAEQKKIPDYSVQQNPNVSEMQTIQLVPKAGKVEISVIDKPDSQIVRVEDPKKNVPDSSIQPTTLKGSWLGEVTNSIGTGLRDHTRKMLEAFLN